MRIGAAQIQGDLTATDDIFVVDDLFVKGANVNTLYELKSAELSAISGLTSAADRLPYFTGLGTASLAVFSAFGRSLVDDVDAFACRNTLGAAAVTTTVGAGTGLTGGGSLNANRIISLSTASQQALVPAGCVASFAMSSPPSGWLKANGAAVSRSTYSSLFSAIGTTFGAGNGSTTFNIPDLRGEFIRGWDDGRGIDSGRSFGSFQDELIEEHQHGMIRLNAYNETGYVGGSANYWVNTISGTFTRNATTADGTANLGSETRPRNIALLACIKY